jgi:small subunit ribosomal protein S16
MPTKIRLQRRGKRGQPFYHIVIADGRAPRDGKFIEKIGTYNPLTRPAEIDIDFNQAINWLNKGAQPTDTVKAIFSYKGILYKSHLLKGIQKGAMTEEQAEIKFQAWLQEKQAKIAGKKKDYELSVKDARKKMHENEIKLNEDKAQAIAKKRAQLAAAEQASKVVEAPVVADFYYLGKILKTFGNKGQLMVHLDVDEPEKYQKLESVYLDVYGEWIPFFITKVELKTRNSAVFSFADVLSADEAEEYTGREMFLPMSTLPELSGQQFYFHEVEGFTVIDARYGNLGIVESILDLHQQALFQVRSGEKEILIPVVDQIIKEVDR